MRRFVSAILLWCSLSACGAPTFVTKPVQVERLWIIKVATYADKGKMAQVHYDHPGQLTSDDLSLILSRLSVQEDTGLLAAKPTPKSVFSAEEVHRMTPGLAEAFRVAKRYEWVTFVSIQPLKEGREVTTGGLFIEGRQLHVIVANHRRVVQFGTEEHELLLTQPLRSMTTVSDSLTFDPARAVVSSGRSSMAGEGYPRAMEVVLNHQEFLAAERRAKPAVPPLPESAAAPRASGTGQGETEVLKGQVKRLESELERLQRRFDEQNAELERLKARAGKDQSAPPKTSP